MTISLDPRTGATGILQDGVEKLTLTPTGLTSVVPIQVPMQSMVRVNTANGYGSTNNKIRKFSNVTNGVNGCVIQGTDITFVNDATNGASATINTNGVYAVSFTDVGSAAMNVGISLNTTTPTTAIPTCAVAEILAINTAAAGNYPSGASWTGYLSVGSVIRPHTDGTGVGTPVNSVQFTITRVS